MFVDKLLALPMKSLGLLLTLLVCPCVCGAQEAPVRPDAPPGLVVLKLKWERRLDPAPNSPRSSHDPSRTATDPDALNNPGGLPTASTSPFPPYVYEYSVEVRNDFAKKIRWLSWVYLLSEPGTRKELGRHEFVTFKKIAPGGKTTLSGRKRSSPSRVISAENLKKKNGPAYEERVEFRCVAYDDGTFWRQPSMPESECAETERRSKSR
jgi:hypothetical protein